MDRNQVIGLVLMAVLLIGYMIIFKKPVEELEPVNTEITTPAEDPALQNNTPESPIADTSDTTQVNYSEQYGIFSAGIEGDARSITIENEKAKFTFNTKGGLLEAVALKDFQTWDERPLILLDAESSKQQMSLPTTKGNMVISDLYYQASGGDRTVNEGDTTTLSFVLDMGNNQRIEHHYRIPGTGYQVMHEVKAVGLQGTILGDQMGFSWTNRMKRQEKNLDDSRNKSTIIYHTLADDTDELKEISQDPQSEQISEGIQWLAFNQKFFNAGIIADKGFTSGQVSTAVPLNDSTVVKAGIMNLQVPVGDLYAGAKFNYYLGPNNFKALKKIAPDYEENVYMGYKAVSWVNKLIIVELFSALESVFSNYGVIIIVIVLIIKLCLFPLSRKSYLSMAKMKALKPELDAMKEKMGGDMQQMQQEQMKLYRQVGVNPLSGCLPLLLQMPFLFAMFFFFPNSIELRGESFLWATDLSTYDVLFYLPFTIPFYGSHVSGFTLLMTLSTILYTWSNNQVSTVQGPMKTIGYVMPVIFMFVLNSYSSGLSFYYFISNIVTFGQQTLIRRFVDEDKIRATLEENKKKNANKKKSKFQARLEEAMKASQEAQKQKQGQKKKK